MAVLLFDFFGTLVDYDPSRTAQGYPRTHAALIELGAALSYDEFLDRWSRTAARFDAASDVDDHEFSMQELGTAFLTEVLDRVPDGDEVVEWIDGYMVEWSAGVRPMPGVTDLLGTLAARHPMAVVSNTHHAPLVPGHLEVLGVTDCFAAVVTSVEVGWRKPHRAIYQAALEALGVDASECTFVGDTRGPDYIGPRSMGMHALLVDPHGRQSIPASHRLQSVLDLADSSWMAAATPRRSAS